MNTTIERATPLTCLTVGMLEDLITEILDAKLEKIEALVHAAEKERKSKIEGVSQTFIIPKNMPAALTVTKLAEVSGFSTGAIYQKHSKGNIPGAFYRGSSLMFDRDQILKWLETAVIRKKRLKRIERKEDETVEEAAERMMKENGKSSGTDK